MHRTSTFRQKAEQFVLQMAQLRWAFSFVFIAQIILSEWFLANLLWARHKYTLWQALQAQPVLWLEAGGWGFLTVAIAALCPKPWLRKSVAGLLGIVSMLLTLGECLLLRAYDTVYNPEMCKSIVASDSRESAEFLASIGHYSGWFLLLIVLILAVSWALHFGLRRLSAQQFVAMGALCFVLGFGLSVGRYRNWQWAYAPARTCTNDRFVWSTFRAYRAGQILAQQRESMHRAAQEAVTEVVDSPLGDSLNVVLVLGESARALSMSCYGYALPTTPHLDSLAKTGELCVWRNAVSPSNATIASTQAMLTCYTNEHPKERWADFPDLLSVLSRGGYATAWITNQESTGGPWSVSQLFGSAADTLVGNPYRLKKTNDLFLPDSLFYDEQVLPHLLTWDDMAQSSPSKRGLFAVVHLMGSHAGYSHRYPNSFARFSAKDIHQNLSQQQRALVAEYDNSILYSDHVLRKIIEHYSHSRSLVIYVSDHGETLFDDPQRKDFVGHAGNALSQGVVRVPLMVYASPTLRTSATEWWQRLQQLSQQPVMTDVLARSIAHLLGIHTRFDVPSDFLFEKPLPHPRKVIAADGATARF